MHNLNTCKVYGSRLTELNRYAITKIYILLYFCVFQFPATQIKMH